MDISGIAKASTSIAETGNREEVKNLVLRRALDMQSATAAQLLESVKAPAAAQNLPAHLGTKINTTA
jgi:hypothetical protein